MKTTVRGVIPALTAEQESFLSDLMNRYCAAVRWSFKRLLEGLKTQDIRLAVQPNFNLNSRQANDAVYDAKTVITSQKELVKLHYANAQKKVEFIEKRLKKAKSPKRITNLQKRLDKEHRALAFWQKHIDNGTFPPVVFGGKKLFLKRCRGLISREEWREARSNRYLSRGDKTKGGNLNTRIYLVDDNIYLDIAAEQVQAGKSVRYNRITVPVYLAHKPSKKTGQINGINYRQIVLDYLKTGNAYQVEIIREQGRYYIHVSIEEETPAPYTARNGAIGVDTNPDGLGITRTDYLGQFKENMWLSLSECTYARTNRRENLIGETAANVVDLAQKLNCLLVVEDLEFKDDKSMTAKFNRMSHGFIWSKFLAMTQRRALRKGVPLVKIKPAFTSVIGILKYQVQYGLSNHEAAGYVIARRGLGLNCEKVPKPLVKQFIKKKKKDGFSKLTNWKQWSSIKKAVVAAIKKHTKKEVQSLVSWQHYRKQLLVSG
ncbi:IS200/IS605 family accessory protein TnpB-related protein [Desulfoscipio gibsoniae]|uniref:Transposase, IS605 OrfB family, central region n=1 Tax=Desulfoscipio gibsoniae DSM 7213 TaxID=767817 RepID=R4KJT1_9FIRM|nr:IS200/IS605 family accessory protein TnpB-related protein [Desulfoscipio gibsoniae]AGL03453.1 transposase, IS605 OrfB family, central region [Desulfoscipio gibsoniae DSM 7213]